MAFSCYFSFTLTNGANEQWIIKRKDGTEWKIRSEYSYSNENRIQQITLNSPEVNKYVVEVDTYECNKHIMTKMQDLSKSNVIVIYHNNQRKGLLDVFVRREIISYLKFFPNIGLCSPDVPVPEKVENSDQKLNDIRTERQLEELSADFGALLKNGYNSDVVLVSGATEIKAHKLILSARSVVFEKMFELPMKENMENRVTISDLEECVLRQMVSYIYSGEVAFKDASMIRGLYIAADKYAIYHLKSLCSSLLQNVTPDTVIDTLILADLYSDSNLKKTAMKDICKHYSTLKATDRWNSFLKDYPSLSVEILSLVIECKEV